jgi:hypothetical protein
MTSRDIIHYKDITNCVTKKLGVYLRNFFFLAGIKTHYIIN